MDAVSECIACVEIMYYSLEIEMKGQYNQYYIIQDIRMR